MEGRTDEPKMAIGYIRQTRRRVQRENHPFLLVIVLVSEHFAFFDCARQNPQSSIAADTPLDMRSHLAREQKKKRTRRTQGTHVPERKRGMESRGDGGGIKGFPESWL